jgi:RNA polymerase sigma-70 factor, ECF subfamily
MSAIISEKQTNAIQAEPLEWLEKHGDYLFRFALSRLRDETTAEDAVQETLLAALSNANRFGCRASERTWLTGILKHKINDYFRRASREESFDAAEDFFQSDGHWKPECEPAEWRVSPEEAAQNQEFRQVIENCLAALPDKTARAFVLREIEGLPTAEICRALDVSPNNLWILLHRARLALRHGIERDFFSR